MRRRQAFGFACAAWDLPSIRRFLLLILLPYLQRAPPALETVLHRSDERRFREHGRRAAGRQPLTGLSRVSLLSTQEKSPGLSCRATGVSLMTPLSAPGEKACRGFFLAERGRSLRAARPPLQTESGQTAHRSWRFRRDRSRTRECTCRAGIQLSRNRKGQNLAFQSIAHEKR